MLYCIHNARYYVMFNVDIRRPRQAHESVRCDTRFVVKLQTHHGINSVGVLFSLWNCINASVVGHDIKISSTFRYIEQQHFFRLSNIKLKWHPVLRRKTVLFYPKGTFKLGQWQGTGSFFNSKKCYVIETKWFFVTFCHLTQSMLWILSVTPVPVGKALGKRCSQGGQMNAFLQFCGRWSGDS